METNIINLTCPSCGGKLQINNDIDRFACGYCGNEQMVVRSGGTISLAPVIDEIRQVSRGVDKTASELAIARLDREIAELQDEEDYRYSGYKKESGGFAIALIGLFAGIVLVVSKTIPLIGILLLIVCVPWIIIGFFRLRRDLGDIRAYRQEIDEKNEEKADHIKNVKSHRMG